MSNLPYHEKTDRDNILHLRQLLQELPKFCSQYFRGLNRVLPPEPESPMPMI